MGVTPQKLQCIVPYLHMVNGSNILRNLIRIKARFTAHLIDTTSALTADAEESMWVNSAVPVIPQNHDCVVLNSDILGKNSFLHILSRTLKDMNVP